MECVLRPVCELSIERARAKDQPAASPDPCAECPLPSIGQAFAEAAAAQDPWAHFWAAVALGRNDP